jgi:hypothetical protein
MALGDWMFYPQFMAGAIYNDNLSLSQDGRTGAMGARLQPSFYLVRDVGVSKTSLFANADARLYPSESRGDTVAGQVGLGEAWELQPDFTLKARAEYVRLNYLTDGGQFSTPGGGTASLVSPQQAQQLQASAALQKGFGRFFVGVSLGEVQTIYDPLATTGGTFSQSYRNSLISTLTERGGYWVSPILYGYAETAENWRDYADDPFTSHGYRAVVGFGSDRLSLFRGEIYGGYQHQIYDAPLSGAAGSPVFGGKVYWYPTRAWTVTTSLDETFSDSSNPTPSNPRGDPARVTTPQLNVAYQLSQLWSAQWNGRFDHSVYLGSSRLDNAWTTGAMVKYEIARNFQLSLDYSYVQVDSNAADSSYVNNIVSLGGVYKF